MGSPLTRLCPAWIALALLVTGPAAIAGTIGFECITGGCGSLAPQLSLEITHDGDQVFFTISNTGSISTVVTAIYWDDLAGILRNPALTNSDGVKFVLGGAPPNLPGGNAIDFDADFLVTNVNQVSNGIDPEEYLTVSFDGNIKDVWNALDTGSLRVGLKLNANGGSLVTAAPEVQTQGVEAPVSAPEPASLVLLGGGLLVMAFFATRRLFR